MLENLELYEEIVNRVVNVLLDFDVFVDFCRCVKSDMFGFKRIGNEFIICLNIIDVVWLRVGEVSFLVEDFYVKVDFSKKIRRVFNIEKGI